MTNRTLSQAEIDWFAEQSRRQTAGNAIAPQGSQAEFQVWLESPYQTPDGMRNMKRWSDRGWVQVAE
jgi:hypothetical protein